MLLTTRLQAGWSGIEIRWGRNFPPIQTGPGPHPASCEMGTGSFPGVKCGRGVLLTTHPLLVPRSWKSSYTTTHRLGHTGPVTGSLYLFISLYNLGANGFQSDARTLSSCRTVHCNHCTLPLCKIRYNLRKLNKNITIHQNLLYKYIYSGH